MTNEILNTHDIAQQEWDGHSEPSDVETAMVATKEAEGRGIEFHVSMRSYTQHDMEALIVEAAAVQIVGKFGNSQMAKAIEAKCIELTNAKASTALEKVTAEIIDQPLTPSFGDKKPVTMREFIGLTGREYLAERVDRDGKPYSGGWGSNNSLSRIELIVGQFMQRQFKSEIEKATNAAISEIQAGIKAQHQAFLEAEKARVREALAKVSA